MKPPRHPAYIVQSLVHAARILEVFRSDGEVLRLRDVVARTGFNKGKCFRLLYTLHACGFLEKVGENQYRAVSRVRPRRKYRIGYASQGQDSSFPREVTAGMIRAAEESHIELIVLDNRYDAKTALRNADQLLKEEVDLVVEFQIDESVAPAIAGKFLEANIPIIAIDIPHPGATYFGANNYEAGLIAGRYLGRWALRHWEGVVDEILMLELVRAGSLPQARVRGMLAGLHETLRVDSSRAVHLDGDGQFGASLDAVRKFLRTSRAKHILVGAATDPSALGAVRAFDEAGRKGDCAVVGHNAEPEGRLELRNPRTCFIGTVAYFPERYGQGVIGLALDILAGKAVPPAVFTRHTLITAENVDRHYPNDPLLSTTTNKGLAIA
jgi:ribose transport system substrate-binding protein